MTNRVDGRRRWRRYGALAVAWLLAVAAPVQAAPPLQPAAPGDPDLHLQVLADLRAQDGVVSRPLPHLHPVHAVYNPEAVIPPQCYTRTEGQWNPCYVCHQDPVGARENRMADGALQLAYSFSEQGMTNHWRNLFADRRAAVATIDDASIDRWVATDNYSALAPRLRAAGFAGWIPDLDGLQHGAAAFRVDGFARDGSDWVAFRYKPLPSTFWPTNGSADDVMIRLPAPFRQRADGVASEVVYKANLALVEAVVKSVPSMATEPLDERDAGEDLDGDGLLGTAARVHNAGRYFGAARGVHLIDSLYPVGTEFLHTVRYLAVDAAGDVGGAPRMKEVRYMHKLGFNAKPDYARAYQTEAHAKEAGRMPHYALIGDRGLDNGYGWAIQGFIEGRDGELRTLAYEENLACMGCHSTIGSTIDKTFSLPRKIDGVDGWGYIDLRGMPDAPNVGETDGEFLTYLRRVGGGGEFRSNPEMRARWFGPDGRVDADAVRAAPDLHALITPSAARARALNKAYRVIVDEQSYIFGRDALPAPPENVYEAVDNATAPTLPVERAFRWDIRLDWGAAGATASAHPQVSPELSAVTPSSCSTAPCPPVR